MICPNSFVTNFKGSYRHFGNAPSTKKCDTALFRPMNNKHDLDDWDACCHSNHAGRNNFSAYNLGQNVNLIIVSTLFRVTIILIVIAEVNLMLFSTNEFRNAFILREYRSLTVFSHRHNTKIKEEKNTHTHLNFNIQYLRSLKQNHYHLYAVQQYKSVDLFFKTGKNHQNIYFQYFFLLSNITL